MDTTGKNGQIEKETLGLVLEEFTQEQQATNQSLRDLIAAVNTMGSKVDELKQQSDKSGAEPAAIDTKAVQQVVQQGLSEVKLMFGTSAKSNSPKFQILLFPEQDAKLFYKIVFSRWLLYLLIMLLLKYMYQWGIHYSDNQKEVKIEQLENDRIKKSWDYLYDHSDKSVKRLMSKAYTNAKKDTGR